MTIKAELQRLHDEKREHLAQLLQEEDKRLQTLANELKAVTDADSVRLAILEDQLITQEFRVGNEVVLFYL